MGLTAITDVHEAQAQFDTALASEISAQNNVEISLEALREITGSYYASISVLNTEPSAPGCLPPMIFIVGCPSRGQ